MSYKTISKKLGIPTSTLSDWFKYELWSIELKNKLAEKASFSSPEKLKLMVKAIQDKARLRHEHYQQQAIEEFPRLKTSSLFIAGLMLYWGEGDKNLKNCMVSISNSDPNLIKIFYLFLRQVLHIPHEKIYASLLLYPDLIDNVQKNFWSKSIGLSLEYFKKSTYITGRHTKKRLSFGVCILRVNSRELKEKIIKWTTLCYRELQGSNLV